jgi:hypothetical protein
MQRVILSGAAVLMAMSTSAFAQATAAATPVPAPAASAKDVAAPGASATRAAAPGDAEQQNGAGFRAELRGKLEKAGFTDISIVSDSYVVQAVSKSGAPVTMLLNPDSLTMISGVGPAAGSDSAAVAAPAAAGMFTKLPAKEDMTSSVVGLTVYNAANQNIGTIKDLALNGPTVQAYIVGVGGFLGVGDHYVAVRPSSMKITWNVNDKTWHAALDTTADALKAAPEYKYPSAS